MKRIICLFSLVLVLVSSAGTGFSQTSEQDSLALVELYYSTDGDNWTNNDNWLTGPLSTWTGIVIYNDRVDSVDLEDNNLIGWIPWEIGDLTNLTYLNLGANQLYDSIPEDIGDLTNLTSLDLGDNQLTGSIPSEIGGLVNLDYLDLYENQLYGSIPAEIGNLTNLTFLDLSYNKLAGSIPATIWDLVNLDYLDLSGNQLFGSIPAEIGNLTNLTSLYLSENQLTGSIPATIGNLVNLDELDLFENQLSGSIPAEIGNLTNLTDLNLCENQLAGSIPATIWNLVNLEYLDLYGNQLSGFIPAEIGNLTNLIYLDLSFNQLVDLPDLGSLANLETLYIEYNKFTFEDIEPNIFVPFDELIYSPQDDIGTKEDNSITQGSSLTLSISVGGTANQYQWLKDGAEITDATESFLTLISVQLSDAGEYICKITNTIATELTLYSRPITVSVIEVIEILSEGFESELFPPSGWVTIDTNFEFSWEIDLTEDPESFDPNSINSAWVYWVDEDQDEWLITPEFSLIGGAAYVEFYTIYDNEWLFNATLKLHISTDGGDYWTQIWEAGDEQGSIWAWRKVMIDLSDYTGMFGVILAWQYVGNDGDDIGIDNVRITSEGLPTSVTEIESDVPTEFGLLQNYPNPFNPETTIKYQLPVTSDVTLKVYNVTGQQVKTLIATQMPAGFYTIKWDGTNESGQPVSSGLYFYHIQAAEFSAVKKMMFIE